MKILHQTNSTLRLHDRLPRWLGWLVGIAFGTPGVIVLLFVSQSAQLSCVRIGEVTRGEVTCEIRRDFLTRQERIAVGTPVRAVVQEKVDSDGDATYRLVVETDATSYPVVDYYSSGSLDKRNQRNQINQFLDDSREPRLEINIDNRWWSYPFGGIFALIGVGFLGTLLSATYYDFDKTLGRLTVERVFLNRRRRQVYALRDIQWVDFEEKVDSDGDRVGRLSFYTVNNERFGSKSFDNINLAQKQATAEAIRQFLGLEDDTQLPH